MTINAEILSRITGKSVNDNMKAVVKGLQWSKSRGGLDEPAILAHYLAQVAHETMGFHYNKEVWGPTAAQKRYEGRADLGNVFPGDGFKFRGRSPIQVTGRYNYRQFTKWANENWPGSPDFTQTPDLVLSDPWEGVAPIWYWDGHDIEQYARANNIEMVTRRINGGLNGYKDRIDWYTKAALVLLGHNPKDVKTFQSQNGLTVDGIAGPKTRQKLHEKLLELPKFEFEDKDATILVAQTERELQYKAALEGIQAILNALEMEKK